MTIGAGFSLVKEAFRAWRDDKAPRLAAALAYYTLFSVAPLLLIAVAIVGTVYGKEAASGQVAQQIGRTVSPQVASVVQDLVANASHRSSTLGAYGVGIVVLLVGASGVFSQIKDALNTVWGVERKRSGGVLGFIKAYVASMSMVLTFGFMLLVSLAWSAALALFARQLDAILPGPLLIAQLADLALSLSVFTILFAALYKVLPDAEVAWRDVWMGAALAAALFAVGKALIGLYLARSGVASAYGAAGSLIVLLLWVYYSAQIFLFGAEITEVYARRRGAQTAPEEDAVPAAGRAAGMRPAA